MFLHLLSITRACTLQVHQCSIIAFFFNVHIHCKLVSNYVQTTHQSLFMFLRFAAIVRVTRVLKSHVIKRPLLIQFFLHKKTMIFATAKRCCWYTATAPESFWLLPIFFPVLSQDSNQPSLLRVCCAPHETSHTDSQSHAVNGFYTTDIWTHAEVAEKLYNPIIRALLWSINSRQLLPYSETLHKT